jgi:organic hydroperoxide reductase OsmC/OhrA
LTKTHAYETSLLWTAGDGEGTASYRGYSRNHSIHAASKPEIAASSDPAFRGDATRYNPEELFVASLSSCHMLWYLHLCSVNAVRVVEYRDDAVGSMEESGVDGGRFTSVTLRPMASIASSDPAQALALHEEAHQLCYIARSVNFPVAIEARISIVPPAQRSRSEAM